MQTDSKKIPCSVGILTYNSERHLRRALESVKDFADIIIADGGSIDATLDIARSFGCTIIDQYTKLHPGSDPYHPIEDFARERNRMVDVATEDWFLWIDSDEYISQTLHEEIEAICNQSKVVHHAYEIPIAQQSPDASVTYRSWKQMHQIRFFNLQTGGRFERTMHERFVFDKSVYTTGRLQGPWFVPLSKPDFTSYGRAVRYRLRKMLEERPPTTVGALIRQAVLLPIRRFGGIWYRYIFLRVRYPFQSTMPFFYYRNQMYSQWVTIKISIELFLRHARQKSLSQKDR